MHRRYMCMYIAASVPLSSNASSIELKFIHKKCDKKTCIATMDVYLYMEGVLNKNPE